jgi:hypothetical protein
LGEVSSGALARGGGVGGILEGADCAVLTLAGCVGGVLSLSCVLAGEICNGEDTGPELDAVAVNWVLGGAAGVFFGALTEGGESGPDSLTALGGATAGTTDRLTGALRGAVVTGVTVGAGSVCVIGFTAARGCVFSLTRGAGAELTCVSLSAWPAVMARARSGSLFGSALCVPSPGTVPRFSAETGYAAPRTGIALLFLGAADSGGLLLLLGALLVLDGTSTELNLTAAVLTGVFIVAALTRGGGAGNGPRDLGGAEGPVTGVLIGALEARCCQVCSDSTWQVS